MAGLLCYAKKLYTNKNLRDEFVEIASSASKGMPRKAKKQFYKALFASTNPEQLVTSNKKISNILYKNRVQRVLPDNLGKTEGVIEPEFFEPLNSARAKLDVFEDMIKLSNATRPALYKNVVNKSIKNIKIRLLL